MKDYVKKVDIDTLTLMQSMLDPNVEEDDAFHKGTAKIYIHQAERASEEEIQ